MKHKLIIQLVEEVEQVKATLKMGYNAILSLLPLCQATYRRWKARLVRKQPPVKKPGPKPLKPLDLETIKRKLEKLVHGRKRSRGVGELRLALQGIISRRDLDALIALERKEKLQKRGSQLFRLTWLRPGSVWSMDVFETHIPFLTEKAHVLSVQDLASSYKLPPLVMEHEPHGAQVAAHLNQLFSRFGAPLFIKRDNGGNLNQMAVHQLFSDHDVFPLNSPFYCAKYNGAIEHTQGEYKQQLQREYRDIESFTDFKRCVALATHDLNHLARRRLKGENSCKRFFQEKRFKYHKRNRQEVFTWIYETASDILKKVEQNFSLKSATRIAARLWLVKNGMLSISKKEIVLPNSS